MPREETYDVLVGTDSVTLRRKGESRVRVGGILGREVADGVETFYLDRLLLAPGDATLNSEWNASGCVSTILTRSVPR